ncbi:MAG: hypothetical protein QM673_17565 [Gordonia sp. (in: high G+C Gram-positive bacteria)]
MTAPVRDDLRLAMDVISLLSESERTGLMTDVECGETFGATYLALADIEAAGQTISVELADRCLRVWPADELDPVDALYRSLIARITKHVDSV